MKMSLSEKLIHTTIRLECYLSDGQISVGTGFFFDFLQSNNGGIPTIVTNKHVINGAHQINLCFSYKSTSNTPIIGDYCRVKIAIDQNRICFHEDDTIDLACILIGDILNYYADINKNLFYLPLLRQYIVSQEKASHLLPVEEIIMVGYPNGIWDSISNLPIVRRGITATPLSIDYLQKAEFLIDCACFQGSSGSPVYLFNNGSYETKDGFAIGSRFLFIGVLYAAMIRSFEGNIHTVSIPSNNAQISTTSIPINLGICIKAEKILDLEKQIKSLPNYKTFQ